MFGGFRKGTTYQEMKGYAKEQKGLLASFLYMHRQRRLSYRDQKGRGY